MVTKADAVRIAQVLAERYELYDGYARAAYEGGRKDYTDQTVATGVFDACRAVAGEIESMTDGRVSSDQFMQWCQTGPAAIAEVERQLGGAA